MNAALSILKGIHPRTGQPWVPIGYRADGRPIWPMIGAEDAPPAIPAPTPAPSPAPAPTWTAPRDQAEFDRIIGDRLARERGKFGGLTPEQFGEMKTEYDTLKAANGTDMDRAVAEAKKTAATEAAGTYLPQLAQAHIEGAANGRVKAEDLAKALKFTDLSRFISNGGVDRAAVTEFIDGIAPAVITPPARRGPSTAGQGAQPPVNVAPGDRGRAEAQKRFGKK